MDGQQQIGDPIEKLYNVVKGKGYYTKSLNEFKTQYSTPEQIDKIYNVVSGDKLYTKSKQDFYNQYFPTSEKKSKVDGASPIVLNGDGPKSESDEMAKYALPVSPEQMKQLEADKKRFEVGEGDVATMEEDPLKVVTEPYKKEAGKRFDNYMKGVERARGESVGQKYLSKVQQAKIKSEPVDELAFGKLEKIKEQAADELFPNGQIAKQALQNYANNKGIDISQVPEDNETIQAAKKKAIEYDLDATDIADTGSIETAAIRAERRNDPNFDAKVSQWEQEFRSNDYKQIIPEALYARVVDKFLAKGNAGLIAEGDEYLKQEYDKLKDGGILLENPTYGATVVANEMSRMREEEGKNNFLGNFPAEKYMDDLAARMYKDDPVKKKIYDDIISKDLPKYIDTPGFLDRAVAAIKHSFEGTKKSVRAIAGSESNAEALYNAEQEAATQVSAEPKGFLHQLSATSGDFGGLIAYMSLGGRALEGAGLSKGTASLITTAHTFYGDELQQARSLYPNDETKQKIRAALSTAAFMALNPFMEGSKALQKKFFDKLMPEVDDVIAKVESGAITREAARDNLVGRFKDGLDFVKDAAKKNLKGVGEMTAFTLFKQGTDKVLGLNEKTYKEVHPAGEVLDVAKMTAMGLAPISIATASGGKRFAKESLYEIARNPKRYHNVAEMTGIIDPEFGKTAEQRHANIEYLAETKNVLDEVGLPDNLQKSYLLHAMNEKILTKKAESITEPTLKKQITDQIKRSQEAKEKILKGENIDALPQEVNTDNLKEHEKFLREMFQGDEDGSYLKAADQKLLGGKTFDKDKVPEFLETVAMQANNVMRGKDGEIVIDDKFDSRKASEERWDKAIIDAANEMYPEYKKLGDSQGEFTSAIKEPSPPMQDPQEGATEGVAPSTLKPKSIFDSSEDLLGDDKMIWMLKAKPEQKTDSGSGLGITEKGELGVKIEPNEMFKSAITRALKDGDYEKAIKEGRMTANDAKEIIESAELEVPQDILIDAGIERGKQQSTPTKEGKPKRRVTAAELEAAQPKLSEGGGQAGGPPISDAPKGSGVVGEQPPTVLSHRGLQEVANEFSLPDVKSRDKKTDIQLRQDARETVNGWAERGEYRRNVEGLVEKAEKGEILTDEQRVILEGHLANVRQELREMDVTSPGYDAKLAEVRRLKDAGEITRSEAGAALRIPTGRGSEPKDIVDAMVEEMDITKSGILTDKQKETVQREFKEETDAKSKWDAKREKLQEDRDNREAQKNIDQIAKSKASKSKAPKDHTEIRKKLRDQLKAAREEHDKWLKDQGIQKSGFGSLTGKEAKIIIEIAKDYIEEGAVKLADAVKKTFDEVKGVIPDITERDIRDVIAGKYSEKKTRSDLAIAMQDLRTEQNLLDKLDALLRSEEPKGEKGKRKRNRQITEIENQIKDIKSFDAQSKNKALKELSEKARQSKKVEADLSKAEKEIAVAEAKKIKEQQALAERETKRLEREFEKEKRKEEREGIKAKLDEARRLEKELSEEDKKMKKRQAAEDMEASRPERELESYKDRMKLQIEKIHNQIKKGDFAPPSKPEPLKMDAEAIRLKDRLIKIRNEKKLRQLKQFYENQSEWEKGVRLAIEIANIPRALMATLDFSALLRQAVIPTIARPRTALRISGGRFEGSVAEMFRGAGSQKYYDRWFADLAETKRFEDMKKSALAITDSTDPNLQAREEAWMSGLADKIPGVGPTLIKGSERAYSMGLNKIRVDLYNRFADAMEQRGLTVENSPEAYKQMAAYINNSTGRGDLGSFLNKAAPLLNALFFSPRLIASRVNMLTYLLQPRFYRTVPKEVRKAYFMDMAKFIGLGITVLALAKLNGAEVEDDPRSSDYGKIKVGNTRWDIWGGFQQYARVGTQMITGERKSTNTGNIQQLDGEGPFGTSRGDVLTSFGRGKLSPTVSMGVDILAGRNIIGEKLTTDWSADENKEVGLGEYLGQHFLPLNATGLYEALQDQGVKAWFTVGIPSTFGIGVQTYELRKSPASQRESKPQGRTRDEKPTKSN